MMQSLCLQRSVHVDPTGPKSNVNIICNLKPLHPAMLHDDPTRRGWFRLHNKGTPGRQFDPELPSCRLPQIRSKSPICMFDHSLKVHHAKIILKLSDRYTWNFSTFEENITVKLGALTHTQGNLGRRRITINLILTHAEAI